MLCPLEFVRQDGPRFIHRCPNCGVEVRSKYRDPSKRKQPCGKVQPRGVGDELLDLLKRHGSKMASKCDCAAIRRQMNKLGAEGCRTKAGKLLTLISAGWVLADGVSLAGLLGAAIRTVEAGQDVRAPTSAAG